MALASFPLVRAITAESSLRDPVLGPTYRTLYRQLSAEAAFDDRMLLQLYIMIERCEEILSVGMFLLVVGRHCRVAPIALVPCQWKNGVKEIRDCGQSC